MTKHLFRPCGGGFFRTITLAAFTLVALAISVALSVALATPATALAADAGASQGSNGTAATLTRLAGEDADQTAAAISQEGFESSECAIIARMDDFADALGASGLAGALDCPILLTGSSELSEAAAEELERLGVKQVYIIGGYGALFEQIDTDLNNLGVESTRIYGDYAWDTSLACAVGIEKLNGNDRGEVIVAMSSNFQDALSISSYAYKYHVPLILETSDAQLTEEAVAFINDTEGAIYVPGGPGAVPTSSVEEVFDGRTILRLYGTDGYDTSNQIATFMTEHGLLSANAVAIASGARAAHGVDALAGAALIGKQGGVMLLANGNDEMEDENYVTIDAGEDSEQDASYLLANKDNVVNAYVLGGEVVAPSAFYDQVQEILTPEKAALPTNGWSLSPTTFTYDGSAHTPDVIAPSSLKEDVDYTVSYTNIKNAGTATVTITGIGTYAGSTELTFTIEKANPTPPENLTTTATAGQTLADVELPQLPEGFDGTLTWKDESESVGIEGGVIEATALYTPKDTANYNAIEVEVSVAVEVEAGAYWLAEAGAANPDDQAGILKSQIQIDEDMAVLHGTKETTSAGNNKAAVEAEYKNYMNGKNANGEAQEVRLYTKWNLNDTSADANKWVEFRIIQVGEHLNDSTDATSGDGSAVTFMATHALPAAQQMNTAKTNTGGWEASTLRTTMNAQNSYVMTGLSDLAPSVKAVTKKSTGGEYYNEYIDDRSKLTDTYTTDTFWTVSYSELCGENTVVITDTENWGLYRNEGSQYSWFTNKITNVKGSNSAIENLSYTRDNTRLNVYWWSRSFFLEKSQPYNFGGVGYNGDPTYGVDVTTLRAVVPAFCF